MLTSEAMIRVALAMEGIHETGFSNRGPAVDQIQDADDLPGRGYAWCVSTWQWVADALGVRLPSGTASVGLLEQAFRRDGLMVPAPSRGCLGFWRVGTGDNWPDHIFGVTRVVRFTPFVYVLRTIEGNTSAGTSGSQTDGGGIHQRTRTISKKRVTFGKVRGNVADADVVRAIFAALDLPGGKPSRRQRVVQRAKDSKAYWLWLEWRLGEGRFAGKGKANPKLRPDSLPVRVPKEWWARASAFLKRRKKRKGS